MKNISWKLRAGAWSVLPVFLMAGLAVGQTQDKTKKTKSDEPAPLAGCESKEIKSGAEKGKQERFFAAEPATVREALLGALAALEFDIDKKKTNDTTVEANKRRHIGVFVGSGGEKMVLHLEAAEEGGQKGTRVSGETKKGFVGRVGQKSWTNAVLDQTTCMMEKSKT